MPTPTPTPTPPPYAGLSPDLVLDAVESLGYLSDGRLLALNSYENRVYQVGMEEGPPLIAKFYRPGRWSDATILEEHAFSRELEQNEIPVACPLIDEQAETLHQYQGFRFSLFPRIGGRHPELDDEDHLRWLGRYLGRIHMVGAAHPFQDRPKLDIESFGVESYQYVLENGFVPLELQAAYRSVAEDVLNQVRTAFTNAGPVRSIRLHGDCHIGNILWSESGPVFLDLDDCRSGPAIQDLWMLLSGERQQMEKQFAVLMDGYQQFCDFDPQQLILVEALRTLRMMHYSAWLARRWHDPAFPAAFPWFDSPRYWEEQILGLREQMSMLDEPALMF